MVKLKEPYLGLHMKSHTNVAVLFIIFIVCLFLFPAKHQSITPPTVEPVKQIDEKEVLILLVKKTFPEPEKMLEVIRRESNYVKHAKGYNCYYNGRSKACKKGDEKNAWSVDCGWYQLNYKGGVCPESSFDTGKSTIEAKRRFDYFKKAKGDGYLAWVAYSSYKN